MIKRLQRKFIAIAMGSLFVILLVILAAVNGVTYYQMNQNADNLLTLLAQNEGKFPELERGMRPPKDLGPNPAHFSEETPFETRYFLVKTNQEGTIGQIDTGHIAAVDSSKAREYAQTVLESGSTGGYLDQYKYLVQEKTYGTLILFLDRGTQLQSSLSLLLLSSGIALATLMVMLLLVSLLSRRAIRPVIESMEKQKRFITDASHEIKTPLAIISANAEVLELTGGPSEWTQSIQNQVGRLGGLVQSLLTLSRMEEDAGALRFTDFVLSDAVEETAQSFAALAQSQGKTLSLSIRPGLVMKGEESGIRQVVSILLDNAVKYASPESRISLFLSGQGKYAKLEVKNACDPVPSDLDSLFDRFYRADFSRSRDTGGYGIGLSVAKAVVEAHKGRISARKDGEGAVCFQAVLPLG